MMTDDNAFARRKEQLTPAQRLLLEKRLRGEQPIPSPENISPQPDNSQDPAGFPPLSFAQQRLWFLNQLEPESSVYNLYMALRLRGRLNQTALERSLNAIVRRHAVLRTTFVTRHGQPVQNITPELRLPLPVIDLSGLPADQQPAGFRRLAVESIRQPFDLRAGPLVRLCLYRLADEEAVLLVCVHHIIFDGWSMDIFQRELAELYAAEIQGRPSPLAELPLQYTGYTAWQRKSLPQVAEPQLKFWKSQLGRSLPDLQLPTDWPRPSIQTYRGSLAPFELPPALTSALKAFSQAEGVTLFMVLLAAFKTLLFRYTNQTDILVGFPIANRSLPEVEALIGFFVNTLVLRTDLSGDPSFRQLLGRVRQTALDAYANQDVPFEQVVQTINPARTLSRQSIFQVMFTFQAEQEIDWSAAGLEVERLEIDIDNSMFDLTLAIDERRGALNCRIEFSTDLFSRRVIDRLAAHYRALLESLLADPDRRISALEILPPDEKTLILEQWTDTWRRLDSPPGRWVHQLIDDQAARSPQAIAAVYHQRALTYAQLTASANCLAHRLRRSGAGPGTLVALCAARSLEMLVAILAVLKSGSGFLPLDPGYPRERLTYMLSDSRAALLLTQSQLLPGLPADLPPVLLLDDILEHSSKFPDGCDDLPPEELASGDSLAYVIYTSGSTGRPKGVAIPHRCLPNLAEAHARTMLISPGSRVLQFSSISFDAAIAEIVPALLVGATLVLADRDELLPTQPLAQTLRSQGITHVTLPPSILAILDERDFPSLRVVISAGEACTQDTISRWSQGRRLVNAYGPTECAIWATGSLYTDSQARPSIGFPIQNVQVYIIDSQLQPVPVGVPGELCIGGVGVGSGYLNQPGSTAEKFIPHPFSQAPGQRLYRTGDKARFLPDGSIDYLGRIDFQVKIHGLRIELGEIEAQLAAQPGVADVVVTVREDRPGDKRLVAYIIPAADQLPSTHALATTLRATLPDYMVPSAFVRMDSFPLTPNGKVDRRGLPPPQETRPELGVAYEKPGTEIERFIARVWQDVLGVNQVGIYDNFFELGGHSLLTIEVHQKLQERFGPDITLIDIFQYPTVNSLALHLQAIQESGPTPTGGQDRALRRKQAQENVLRQRSQLRLGLKQRPGQKDLDPDE